MEVVRENIKRIPIISLVAVLLFVTVFSCVGIAAAASGFTPRLEAPSSDNEYYYGSKNIFYTSGYGMPNCTAYAYGRAYEILGSKPSLCTGDANKWYDYNKNNSLYSYGQTPKLGAIACWTYSGGGHVAVVEKIENGTITFSNSAWGYLNFYLTTASTSASNPGQSGWTFQGYIYIGDFKGSEEGTAEVQDATADASDYSVGYYYVTADVLNVRGSAGTSSPVKDTLIFGDLVEVTQIKPSDGYVWGYIGSGWTALDYCEYIGGGDLFGSLNTEYCFADINGDGAIDINDVTCIQKYLAGYSDGTDISDSGDVNADEIIDINDATCMQKYLAGLLW